MHGCIPSRCALIAALFSLFSVICAQPAAADDAVQAGDDSLHRFAQQIVEKNSADAGPASGQVASQTVPTAEQSTADLIRQGRVAISRQIDLTDEDSADFAEDLPLTATVAADDEADESVVDTSAKQAATPDDSAAPATLSERFTSISRATTDEKASASTSTSFTDKGWILKTVTALGVVLGLIYLLRFLWIKLTGQVPASSHTAVVEVLSRTTIAPRNHVLLMRLGQRILVVSDSGSGMNTLANIDDPQEVASLLANVTASRPTSITRNFRDIVDRFNGEYSEDDTFNEEIVVDQTRSQLSGLLSRIRNAGT